VNIISEAKWEVVRWSMASRGGRFLANEGGKVLSLVTGFHYKVGLSRAALAAAAFVRPGNQLQINDGKLLMQNDRRRWVEIYEDKALFAKIQQTLTVAEEAATPDGLLDQFRWEVFYDKRKFSLASKVFAWTVGLNLSLSLGINALFKHLSHGREYLDQFQWPIIQEPGLGCGILPHFHSLSDPALADDISVRWWAPALLVTCYTMTLAEFHRDKVIIGPGYRNWAKAANVTMALGLAGDLSQRIILELFGGAWDYFYFYVGPLVAVFNTSDVLGFVVVPTVIGAVAKTWRGATGNIYSFSTSIIPTKAEVDKM